MRDQHYFGYAFLSAGSQSEATFTARAHADLDCDGEVSTFERYGYGSPEATHRHCAMRTSPALYFNHENE